MGKQITPKKMAPVVETLDSAIHRINPYRGEKYSLEAGDFSLRTRKISPIALYTGQRFIQWITIEKPLPGSYMLVPMLSLHCMALHFFRRNHGPESTVRRLIIARRRHQRGYNSSHLYLSFI